MRDTPSAPPQARTLPLWALTRLPSAHAGAPRALPTPRSGVELENRGGLAFGFARKTTGSGTAEKYPSSVCLGKVERRFKPVVGLVDSGPLPHAGRGAAMRRGPSFGRAWHGARFSGLQDGEHRLRRREVRLLDVQCLESHQRPRSGLGCGSPANSGASIFSPTGRLGNHRRAIRESRRRGHGNASWGPPPRQGRLRLRTTDRRDSSFLSSWR